MRIHSDQGAQPLIESSRSNTPTTNQANTQASGQSLLGDDKAQLSGAGAQVTALTAQALQLPEVRQERVQALRQAVQSGIYAVNPQTVAGSIVDYLALDSAA
jgi:flagellar biosynthesis anti-sigma factor FlgM